VHRHGNQWMACAFPFPVYGEGTGRYNFHRTKRPPRRQSENRPVRPSGRRAARATLGGGFPTRTVSMCAAGSQFPLVHVSAQPPSHPGRSDFPSPVGGSSWFPQGTFPQQPKLKHSSAYTPDRHGYNPGSTCESVDHCYPVLCPEVPLPQCPLLTESRFAWPQCYRVPGRCRSTVSVGVTRPSSLIPAHASDQNPLADFGCPYFGKSLQVATSPCWEMALPDVISAIFVWVLGSVPRHD
jgi:hypothetical protein